MPWGGYPKFITQGLNNDYLPLWLQEGGVNTYYVGKFLNAHSTHNYRDPMAPGWTSSNFLLQPGVYDYLNTFWAKNHGPWTAHPGEHAIDITTKNALEMLDIAVEDGKPFFLTVAPAVPHMGINSTTQETFFPIPQTKWENAFTNEKVPRTPNWNPTEASGASWLLNLPHQNTSVVDGLDEMYRRRIRCVAGLDDMVGELIAALEKHGILDNTHVIYTTDNGYHIGQHRMGPGKKTGYETDINIPLVWRGPGVPAGKVTNAVSTHTDLAPTWLTLFGLPLRTKLDGQAIPIILNQPSQKSGEHVNVELWGNAAPYEGTLPYRKIGWGVKGKHDNTYKGLRIVADEYSIYYSVWCTNEHELYDMLTDEYQMENLLADTWDILNVPEDKILLGWSLRQVVTRLDALMMVLKTCVGIECTRPWLQIHPQGNVETLQDALNPNYDRFYESQPKVAFSACKLGYLIEHEGPQTVMKYIEN
ncbi:uncharacterized protein PFLUO_LOCUS9091 [Penicillium psychrofluorescens]|uniref:uncharacterized protein n=1 Tax=Penicillium psychrofluorescens TaxID=3158075 RepID=UPI003CCDA0DB